MLYRFASDRTAPGWRLFASTFCVFALFLLMINFVQRAAGAPDAAFGGFPDEPAHYVGGLVAHDYLMHGLGKAPVDFVKDYYIHVPYFALGVWPPFFYLLEGCWMTLFGAGRVAVLWLIAVCGAGLATVLFSLLQKEMDGWTAALAAALFLFIPIIQWSVCLVMADLTCSLFAIAAILFFARFMERQQWRDAILFGCFSGISLLTKNSTYFIVLVPPFVIAATRRWDLLRRPALWVAPLIVACMYAPWLVVSRPFLLLGTYGLQLPGFWGTQREYLAALWEQTSFLLPASILGAGVLFYRRPRKITANAWCMLAVLPAVSLGIFFARVPVQPRLLTVAYIALIFFAAQLCAAISGHRRRVAVAVAGLLLFATLNWIRFRLPPGDQMRTVAAFLQARDGGQPGSVLVPSAEEGPWIAEFTQSEAGWPLRTFLRPTKLFGEEDWNGSQWRPLYKSASDIEALFVRIPVKYCILRTPEGRRQYPHDQLLETVVADNSQLWRLVFDNGKQSGVEYRVYENRRWTSTAEAVVYGELKQRLPKYLW
jgi:hypothetical protein